MKIGDEMENKEHEAFESVFTAENGWDLTFINGCYQNIGTFKAFAGWQAAKKHATPEGFVFNDVFAERKRQIDQEHYSHEHDDEYDQNELLRAAVSYASNVVGRGWIYDSKNFGAEVYQSEEAPDLWPWDLDFWKPKNPRRDLVRAAALIIAEIEKIDRSTGAKS